MPYTKKQKDAFRAAAHDPKTAKAMGMTKKEAGKMYEESKKTKTKPPVKKGK